MALSKIRTALLAATLIGASTSALAQDTDQKHSADQKHSTAYSDKFGEKPRIAIGNYYTSYRSYSTFRFGCNIFNSFNNKNKTAYIDEHGSVNSNCHPRSRNSYWGLRHKAHYFNDIPTHIHFNSTSSASTKDTSYDGPHSICEIKGLHNH